MSGTELYRQVFERGHLGQLVYRLESSDPIRLRLVAANQAAALLTGGTEAPLEEALGKTVVAASLRTPDSPFTEACRQAIKSGTRHEFGEVRLDEGPLAGHIVTATAVPLSDAHIVVYFEDVTERATAQQALLRRDAQLAEAQRLSGIGSWEWDVPGNLIYWSDEMYRLHGFEPSAAPVSYEWILDRIHPDDRAEADMIMRGALSDREPFAYYHRIVRQDGATPILHARGRVSTGPSGEPIRMSGTGQDVTDQRRAEDALRSSQAQLAASNRELLDFAFIASHDLQEPLRKIIAFADRLTSKYGPELGPEGSDYLRRMVSAARRGQSLVDSLLELSRVTSRAREFELVELNDVASDVLLDLEVSVAEAGAVVEVTPLPAIEADATQMRQLFQNLLANSLKFRAPDRPMVIVVRSETVTPSERTGGSGDSMCRIEVADNGIGFDEQYAERIFLPLQRLQGHGVYPGTGMGLAICRKIVDRHGGSVTAVARPGEGAVFTITLPMIRTPRTETP